MIDDLNVKRNNLPYNFKKRDAQLFLFTTLKTSTVFAVAQLQLLPSENNYLRCLWSDW